MTSSAPRLLAACFRQQILGLAIFAGDELLEVRRHRFYGRDREGRMSLLMRKLAVDYNVVTFIVEPSSVPECSLLSEPDLHIETLSLRRAKELLLPPTAKSTHDTLCHEVIRRHPDLIRLVTILKGTGTIAMSERWKTVALLAVAMGLAYHCERRQSTEHILNNII